MVLAAGLLVTVGWSWAEASKSVPSGYEAAGAAFAGQDTVVAARAANPVNSRENVVKWQDQPPPDDPPHKPPPDEPPPKPPHKPPHDDELDWPEVNLTCTSAALPFLFVGLAMAWTRPRKS
jgi:hypothetical protein